MRTLLGNALGWLAPIGAALLLSAGPIASGKTAEQPVAFSEDPILRIEAGGHAALLGRMATDAANTIIATVSYDKTVRIWSAETGDLIRIARVDAPIIFSMRDDPIQEPEYPAMLSKLEDEGKWEPVFTGSSFHSMPYAEPEVTHRIHVYRAR